MDIRSFFGKKKEAQKLSEEAIASTISNDIDATDIKINNETHHTSVSTDGENIQEIASKNNKNNSTKSKSSHSQSSKNKPSDKNHNDSEDPEEKNSVNTAEDNTEEADCITVTIPKELRSIITWKANESVPYQALVDTFESISKVPGRLDKEELFTKLFRAVILTTPNDLEAIVYLSCNLLSPAYEGLELGIGDALLVKAICEATGRRKDAVDDDYRREGDLGTVALISRASQRTLSFASKPKPLTCTGILSQLRVITRTKGDKAQGRKVEVIKALMVRCSSTGCEAKYIVRALQGKLRIGTAEQTVLVALAHASAQSPTSTVRKLILSEAGGDDSEDEEDIKEVEGEGLKEAGEVPTVAVHELVEGITEIEPHEARKLRVHLVKAYGRKHDSTVSSTAVNEWAVVAVKRAFSECPNVGLLVQALLTEPLYALYRRCKLTVGVPISPMLAKPTKEIGEVLKRLSGLAFTMEYKYDGERAQVHLLENGTVKIFSRNSEDNSEKYPDLTQVVKNAAVAGVSCCVIDCEVVAYDREKGCLLPFQILSTRKRKVEEGEEHNQKVKVVLQAFDMLFINGKSLLTQSLRTRRRLLRASFVEVESYFYFASGCDHVENGDSSPIETYMQEACAAMCEGLMVKTLDSNASYEPSKRSLNWLKLKKDYIDGMGVCDSVDLVVLGAYHGRGKRVNVYGAYLMACYDPDRDEFQSVCKVGTGFKDEDLTRLAEKMKPFAIASHVKPMNYNVADPLFPDVWFASRVVWELQAADLSKSSVHRGAVGRVDPSSSAKGIGLRFPRYIRDRDDKRPESATSAEQIADMYFSQAGEGGAPDDRDEGDNSDNDLL